MQENLVKVIEKRFNTKTKYLDLSNYHRDPGMTAEIVSFISSNVLHFNIPVYNYLQCPYVRPSSMPP